MLPGNACLHTLVVHKMKIIDEDQFLAMTWKIPVGNNAVRLLLHVELLSACRIFQVHFGTMYESSPTSIVAFEIVHKHGISYLVLVFI